MDVLIGLVFDRAPDSVQVTLSRVCWTAYNRGRIRSLQFPTLKKAVKGNCSLAITRILQKGIERGGCKDVLAASAQDFYIIKQLVATGSSIPFARYFGKKKTICSRVFWFVSKYGPKYVRWLSDNDYIVHVPSWPSREVLISLAQGHEDTIKYYRKHKSRNSVLQKIVWANGHGRLWPLNARDANDVLSGIGKYLGDSDFSSLVSVLEWKSQISLWRANDRLATRVYDYTGRAFYAYHYKCSNQDDYEVLTSDGISAEYEGKWNGILRKLSWDAYLSWREVSARPGYAFIGIRGANYTIVVPLGVDELPECLVPLYGDRCLHRRWWM
jgi:hypothetical protein